MKIWWLFGLLSKEKMINAWTPLNKNQLDLVKIQRGKSAGPKGINIKAKFAWTNEITFNSYNKDTLQDHLFPQSIPSMLPLGIACDPTAK